MRTSACASRIRESVRDGTHPGDHLLTDIDLDVHLGGDAIDYNAIANQESLSGMETELRKLADVADEILEEMEYLKTREMRLNSTNSTFPVSHSLDAEARAWIRVVLPVCRHHLGRVAGVPSTGLFQAQVPHRLALVGLWRCAFCSRKNARTASSLTSSCRSAKGRRCSYSASRRPW